MQEEDRRRIASNRKALAECIVFQDLIPFLIQKAILTDGQVEEIESNYLHNDQQVQALLTELEQPFTSCSAFDQFIECLIETGHTEAAGLIRPDADVTEFGSNSTPPPSLNDQPRLLVKKAENFMSGEAYYKMSSRPRGFWVIINNYEFEGERYETRKGSEKDAKRMEEVASDLGFDVKPRINLTGDEMYEFLQSISKEDDLKKHDALVVQIMSHGEYDLVAGSDGVDLHVHDIKTLFDGVHCEALIGKPKIFIFVSCRGADCDGGGDHAKCLADPASNFASSFEHKCSLDVSGDNRNGVTSRRRCRRPSGRVVSDMLTAYSTSPGYVSHRHPEDGTYYISALARVLMERSCDTHLVDILSEVDNELSKKMINDEYKQTAGYELYGFNKKLFFNPGFFDDDM